MDSIIGKYDFKNTSDWASFQMKDELHEWYCNNVGYTAGKRKVLRALTVLQGKVCVSDFPTEDSTSGYMAKTTFSVISDCIDFMIYSKKAKAGNFHRPLMNFLKKLIGAGPGTTHLELISAVFQVPMVDFDEYFHTLKGKQLRKVLTLCKKEYILKEEEISYETYADKVRHCMRYILQDGFTDDQCKRHQADFLDVYVYFQYGFMDRKEKERTLMSDMADWIYKHLDSEPIKGVKGKAVFVSFLNRLKEVVLAKTFPANEEAVEHIESGLNAWFEGIKEEGNFKDLYGEIMDFSAAIFTEKAGKPVHKLVEAIGYYFYDDKEAHLKGNGKMFEGICKKLIQIVEQTKDQSFLALKFADAIVSEVLVKTMSNSSNQAVLLISLIKALIQIPLITTLDAAYWAMREKEKALKWKEHLPAAKEIFEIINKVKVPEGDDQEKLVEKYKDFTEYFLDQLKKGGIHSEEMTDRTYAKTVSHVPFWSRDISKLLNPTDELDWRLLSSRLGYSNDDIRGWAQQHDPCMAMLNKWYAVRKTSEATHAVLIALQEMNRMDAAAIVENAMKMAETAVETELFESASPPAVFISYQWGIKKKVEVLKQHLEMAGFECWMDIGQMGGLDKISEKTDQGIRASKVIISCVTENYAKSLNCNREVNLSVSLGRPIILLLMEKQNWPPEGSMGPIFSEYLFIRFFTRPGEETKDQRYWGAAKFRELLMGLNYNGIVPDEEKVQKEYKNWWTSVVEEINIEKKKDGSKGGQAQPQPADNTEVAAVSPDIFISYQWGKQKQSMLLYRRLTGLGYSCWMDIYQMGGGDSLYDKINRAVRGCKLVLSCVTIKYALSPNCRREVSLAEILKKPIVPLALEKMTFSPNGPLYIDFSKDETAQEMWVGKEFDELVGKIEANLNVPALLEKEANASDSSMKKDSKPNVSSAKSDKEQKANTKPESPPLTPQQSTPEPQKSNSCTLL